MAGVHIYLFFDGNCAEAFDFYKSVFGGEFSAHMTFETAPPDMNVPAGERGRIMHMSMPLGPIYLMGSDTLSNGEPVGTSQAMAISYAPESEAETRKVFDALFAGGEVTQPLEEMFWGALYGQGVDKFGVRWMVNYDKAGA